MSFFLTCADYCLILVKIFFNHKILGLPPVNLRSINKSKFPRLIWEYYEGTAHIHICIVNHRQYHLPMAVEQELTEYVLWARSDGVS